MLRRRKYAIIVGMSDTNFRDLDGETLLKTLHTLCVEKGASDIHASPEKGSVRLEWRLNGVLQLLDTISAEHYADLLRRVKFCQRLRAHVLFRLHQNLIRSEFARHGRKGGLTASRRAKNKNESN